MCLFVLVCVSLCWYVLVCVGMCCLRCVVGCVDGSKKKSVIPKKYPARKFTLNYGHYRFILIRKIKSAPRISVIIFAEMVTWDCPLRTDSASLKSLESLMQLTSFCSS